MNKLLTKFAVLTVSLALIAGCSGDGSGSGSNSNSNTPNTNNSAAITGVASSLKASGCRGCHGQPNYRMLPDNHTSYTTGDAQCLTCHSTTGQFTTGGTHLWIPHAINPSTTTGGTTGGGTDGASLFSSKCASCHGAKNAGGAIAKVKKPTSVSAIKTASMTYSLTDDQLSAVVTYINGL